MLPDLHQFSIPVFLLCRKTGRMMSTTLTLSSFGFHAGVSPQGWMQGKTDVLAHPTEQKHTNAWARRDLHFWLSFLSWSIWLLLACLLHNFLQMCSFCFYKLQQLCQRQTDRQSDPRTQTHSISLSWCLSNNKVLYCTQFRIWHAFSFFVSAEKN